MTSRRAEIPNYLPGRRWGTQGEAHPHRCKSRCLPKNRSSIWSSRRASSRGSSRPSPRSLSLSAWPGTIAGRLWIAESTDYPNTKQRDGQGRDRISILEDSNGDGRADSFKVFAEGLNIPTSLVCHDGGVIVLQRPTRCFSKIPTVTAGPICARCSSRVGASATRMPARATCGGVWITGSGESSATRRSAARSAASTMRLARHFIGSSPMDPSSSSCAVPATTHGAWASARRASFSARRPTAVPSVYMPIANRYYEAVRGQSPARLESIAASNRFYPVTDKVRQVDYHGGFTAAAGHALYTARTYPRHYWNQTAFVAEPTGHLIATFTLHRKGSDIVDYYGWNLLASDDEWTSPIAAEVGPDGHVWVIDWYNYIVQHNPTPQGFKTGKGNAYETPLRDKTHGRIYRIVYRDASPSQPPTLDPADSAKLVAALRHDNQLWRLHAQRLLVERQKTDVVPALIELARGHVRSMRLDSIQGRSMRFGRCTDSGRIANVETPGRPCRSCRAQTSIRRSSPQCRAGLARGSSIGKRSPCRRVAS